MAPEKIQSSVAQLEKKTNKILGDLDQVSSMESDLKEKGADVPSQDELNQIKSKLTGSISQANDYVKNLKQDLENKKKEAEAEQEEQLGVKDPKKRSQKEKDEMNAFLSGASDWPSAREIDII